MVHNHYVRYNDTYVKEEGKWLIQHRIANFMISDSRELGKIAYRTGCDYRHQDGLPSHRHCAGLYK